MFRPFMAIIKGFTIQTLTVTDKTWWCPWMAETCCFDININFQWYTSFISYELCYWLPSHIDIFTYTTGMTLLKIFLQKPEQHWQN